MQKKSKSKATGVEIVPFSFAESNAEAQRNLKLEISRMMVEETVQQAMSSKGAELQPFFGSREIAYEIKRRQNVHEQNKFTYYFEDWGCMVCGTSKAHHSCCGMCSACYWRIKDRLKVSLRKRQPPKGSIQPTFMDTMRIAREALAPPTVDLSDETRKTRSKK